MVGIGYIQELEQKQILSQKMIQSANILQMDVQELEVYIQQQALENPLIDLDTVEDHISASQRNVDSIASGGRDQVKEKLEWLQRCDEQNRIYYAQEYEETEEKPEWNLAVEENCLQDYLMSQLIMLVDDETERSHMEFLVNSLDSKGYLREDKGELAVKLGISLQEVERLVKLLQTVEPVGVGASTVEECLILQIRRMREAGCLDEETAKVVSKLIQDHLEMLGKRHFVQIGERIGRSPKEVEAYYGVIQKLNPIPGNSFSSREKLKYIKPDVTVVKFKDYLEVLINEAEGSRISINEYYLRMMKQDPSEEVAEYIQNKYRQAQWVSRCIEERKNTLMRVSREIVDIQKNFFESPEGKRVPMNLEDIASRLELHESTVSRAIRNKFLQCSRGIYPLNYFFAKGVSNRDREVTVDDIKKAIVKLVDQENKKKPLSDQKIAEALKQCGMEISRRTVAKYRNELLIPDASGRRNYI